jgi:mitochondrial fission protein ELM1
MSSLQSFTQYPHSTQIRVLIDKSLGFLAGESEPSRDTVPIAMENEKVIWQIKDGKRGHENQSAGLIRALAKLHPIKPVELPIETYHASWMRAMIGKLPHFENLPVPDLIVGCGSRTHSTLLCAGRTTGAPTLLLMAPPRGLSGLFKFCITPEHDQRRGRNIIATKGAINLVESSEAKEGATGLILLGGPSQHHDWNTLRIQEQIAAILEADAAIQWIATSSRRTPFDTLQSIHKVKHPQFKLIPFEDTDANWLPDQLGKASQVWVTEDSVSMIYEALSSGAKVGVLPVPRKPKPSRVVQGVDQLISEEGVLPFTNDDCKLSKFAAPPPLNEAERVAKIVANRLSWS